MEFYPIHFDKLSSTNDYSIELLSKSNPIEGTVISTYNQQSGKGQIGREWFSDVNNNITCSVILRPHFLSVDKLFYLNIILSLAIQNSLAKVTNKEFQIKWPNDIYFQNKKIAGLLINQFIQGTYVNASVFGFGINVNQIEFPSEIPNPTSLSIMENKQFDLEEIQYLVLNELSNYYELLRNRAFIELKKKYLNSLYGRGEIHSFLHLEDNKSFDAEILGIDNFGRLALNSEGRVSNYELNQIKLILKTN